MISRINTITQSPETKKKPCDVGGLSPRYLQIIEC